jgi:Ca-activated chloride channel family protein
MSAMPALASSAQSHGCRLVAIDGRLLPLRAVEVTADAKGGLARVRLRQTFANPYEEPLAATYQLPLPDDGAVVDFAFHLQGKRIAGRVEKRAEARAVFEQAVLEGRTAALLEQDRSSLFTQELGNLPPGAELHVEIDVEQLLVWRDGGWEWRWPTVVGPRYLGAPGETPDAARI